MKVNKNHLKDHFIVISKMIRLASFDMGSSNFSQYVEEFDPEIMYKLEARYKALPEHLRRKTKGPMNSKIEELLRETTLCGTRITTGVYDFTVEIGQGWDILSRQKFLNHMERFKKIWNTCDIFIIEQQYFNTGFKGKKPKFGGANQPNGGANIDAIKIGEATFMWLLQKYPDVPIMYFGSQYKTQIFGAPWKMTKPERKKWSTNKAKMIYTERKDEDMIKLFELAEAVKRKQINTKAKIQTFVDDYECDSLDAKELALKIIKDKQKLDDVGDSCTQAQAFKFKSMVGCF